MKKIIFIVFALLFAITVFVGCAQQPATDESAQPAATSEAQSSASAAATSENTENSAELPDMEPVELKWAMSYASDHPCAIITQEVCDEIKEETNGTVTFDLYVANTIGSEQEITDMVRNGDLFGGTIGLQMFENYVPEIAGWRLPFTFASLDDFTKFYTEYAEENLFNTNVLTASGMRSISMIEGGMRRLTTKGYEVHTPADLNGVKIRSMEQPASIATVKALGGNPIPIAWSELYMALQTGTAYGQENPIANVYNTKFYEVQDYLILTDHAVSPCINTVNEEAFQSLPAEYQTYLTEKFIDCANRVNVAVRESESDYVDKCEEAGMTVIENDELDMDAFRANADKVISETFVSEADKGMLEWHQQAIDWVNENA